MILSLAVGLPVLHAVNASMERAAAARAVTTTRAVELPGTGTDVLPARGRAAAVETTAPVSLELRFASKYAVGTKQLFGMTDATLPEQLDKQAKSDTDRVAIAVVAGEIVGPDAAVKRLSAIDSADARAFERAYATTRPAATGPAGLLGDTGDDATAGTDAASYPSSPTAFDVNQHSARYGFFADLAAASGKPDAERQGVDARAKKAVYLAFTMLAAGGAALLGGLALCVTGIVLAAMGKLRFRTRPPVAPATYYVEAFAIYLVLLLGGSLLTRHLPAGWPVVFKLLPLGLVVLFAAAWPLLRGAGRHYLDRGDEQRGPHSPGFDPVFALPHPASVVPEPGGVALAFPEAIRSGYPPAPVRLSNWQAYRRDVGLHAGTGLFKEIGFGIVGYLAGLPIVGLALLLVLLLSQWAEQTTTHPIVQTVDQTSVWSLLLLAAVFAPVTEELMFRGLFVSHLRRGLGIAAAAVLSGLIFAAVHPQGWLAIPALTAIGGWLAVVRQWRGSLIPSVVMHAINNGVIVLVMVNLLK